MPKVIHTNIKRKLTYILASIPIFSNLVSIIPVSAISASTSEEFNFTVNVQSIPTLALQIGSSSDNLNPSGNGLNLDIAPKYATNSIKTEPLHVYVYTSSDNGYQLSMATSATALTGDFTLTNGTRPAINSLSNTTTGITYDEFNSYNDDSVINRWGYTLTKTNLTTSTTNAVNKFLGVKDVSAEEGGMSDANNYMPLNAYNHESGESTSESETIIDFGVNINTEQPAGAYTTTITFLAIANVPNPTCERYTICYDSNGVLSDSKMAPEPVSSTTVDNGNGTSTTTYQDTTLWASNFKNPSGINGYGFAGWNTRADGTGTNYGPNETVSLSDLNTIANNSLDAEGAILYANWIPADKDYTMQTFTQSVCDAKLPNVGDVMALRDIRDDNVYTIAKLGMGWDSANSTYTSTACWMVENLRLGNKKTDGTTDVIINALNTNNPTSDFITNGLSANNGAWCTDSTENCVNTNQVSIFNTVYTGNDTTGTVTQMNSKDSNVYSYGNYYNWYSATAGNGIYGIATNNYDIVGDICPAGWRLPTGGDNRRTPKSEFYLLGIGAMGVEPNGIRNRYYPYYESTQTSINPDFYGKNMNQVFSSYPNNHTYAGSKSDNLYSRGGDVHYWSSTALNNPNAYNFFGNFPGTADFSPKTWGFLVRCIVGS